MFDLKNDVLNKLVSLYNMYEEYAIRNKDTKINILIQDGSISFYVYNSKENVDEFIITFSDKENSLYKYISVGIYDRLSTDMVVYNEDNEFYNKEKPYLKMIVNDDNMLYIMKSLVLGEHFGNVDYKNNVFDELSSKVPFTWIYPFKFMYRLDERVSLSKKLLKIGDK